MLTEPYRVYTKFAERALIPCDAIDKRYKKVYPKTDADWKAWKNAKFVTNDGKFVKVTFIAVTNNEDHSYDEHFDNLCREMYNMSFQTFYAVWASRMDIDNWWYYIGMELYEQK